MDIEKLIERLYTKQQSYASYTDSELAHVIKQFLSNQSAIRKQKSPTKMQIAGWKEDI